MRASRTGPVAMTKTSSALASRAFSRQPRVDGRGVGGDRAGLDQGADRRPGVLGQEGLGAGQVAEPPAAPRQHRDVGRAAQRILRPGLLGGLRGIGDQRDPGPGLGAERRGLEGLAIGRHRRVRRRRGR